MLFQPNLCGQVGYDFNSTKVEHDFNQIYVTRLFELKMCDQVEYYLKGLFIVILDHIGQHLDVLEDGQPELGDALDGGRVTIYSNLLYSNSSRSGDKITLNLVSLIKPQDMLII